MARDTKVKVNSDFEYDEEWVDPQEAECALGTGKGVGSTSPVVGWANKRLRRGSKLSGTSLLSPLSTSSNASNEVRSPIAEKRRLRKGSSVQFSLQAPKDKNRDEGVVTDELTKEKENTSNYAVGRGAKNSLTVASPKGRGTSGDGRAKAKKGAGAGAGAGSRRGPLDDSEDDDSLREDIDDDDDEDFTDVNSAFALSSSSSTTKRRRADAVRESSPSW